MDDRCMYIHTYCSYGPMIGFGGGALLSVGVYSMRGEGVSWPPLCSYICMKPINLCVCVCVQSMSSACVEYYVALYIVARLDSCDYSIYSTPAANQLYIYILYIHLA